MRHKRNCFNLVFYCADFCRIVLVCKIEDGLQNTYLPEWSCCKWTFMSEWARDQVARGRTERSTSPICRVCMNLSNFIIDWNRFSLCSYWSKRIRALVFGSLKFARSKLDKSTFPFRRSRTLACSSGFAWSKSTIWAKRLRPHDELWPRKKFSAGAVS